MKFLFLILKIERVGEVTRCLLASFTRPLLVLSAHIRISHLTTICIPKPEGSSIAKLADGTPKSLKSKDMDCEKVERFM